MTDIITGVDGVATNTLQNIELPNPSILESIAITAKVVDPSDDTIVLFSDSENVFAGNQFAYSFDNINSVELKYDRLANVKEKEITLEILKKHKLPCQNLWQFLQLVGQHFQIQ